MIYVNMICAVCEKEGKTLKHAETANFVTPKEGAGRSNRLGDAKHYWN